MLAVLRKPAYIGHMKLIPNRSILSLTGPDTISLLERTVTHTVANWQADEVRYGGLLTPQGKVIADYLATRTEDGVLLDVHEDARDDLARRFKLFRLRADVKIEARDDLRVLQSDAGTPDPRSTHLPRRFIMPASADAVSTDYHELRISAGIPEWGSDYGNAEVFPTDVNMDVMNGVDYSKGCFVGQEVASRMKRRGKIRKRTVLVKSDDLTIGDKVMAGETPAGNITSSAGPMALALIRIDRAAGKTLICGSQDITLETPSWLEAEMAEALTND